VPSIADPASRNDDIAVGTDSPDLAYCAAFIGRASFESSEPVPENLPADIALVMMPIAAVTVIVLFTIVLGEGCCGNEAESSG
jgi:hypothetical protein